MSPCIALAFCLLTEAPASAQVGAPGNLAATPLHGRRIDLSWDPGSGDPEGYRVARQCTTGDAEGYCTIAVLASGTLGYRDVGVEEATVYHYRVEAFSDSETGSATISATTPPSASLPVDTDPAPDQPVYFEPQGAWSLGAAVPLTGIANVHLVHNLAAASDLGVLLDEKEPYDEDSPCRQHISFFRKAGTISGLSNSVRTQLS